MQPKDPGYPRPTSVLITGIMKANKRANTKPEILIRSSLHKLGYRFRKDFLIRVSNRAIRPDIVFTKYKIAIFVDGCFWHLCPQHGHIPKSNIHYWEPKLNKNAVRDRADTNLLKFEGWQVLRIWEHTPSQEAVQLILSFLKENRDKK